MQSSPTRNIFLPSLTEKIRRNGCNTHSQLLSLAEDKAASLSYEEARVQLPSSVRSTFLMVFSPDATRVASTHGDHKIYISSLTTKKVIRTLEGIMQSDVSPTHLFSLLLSKDILERPGH